MPDEPVRVEEKVIGEHRRQVPIFSKACTVCSRTFEGTARAKYCSRACATRAWESTHVENRRERQRRYHARKRQGVSDDQGGLPGA